MSSDPILDNLTYLTEHLTNLPKILQILLQNGIIGLPERDFINAKETPFMKNEELLMLLLKKDLKRDVFLDLLRKSNNNHCANEIEGVKEFSDDEAITKGQVSMTTTYERDIELLTSVQNWQAVGIHQKTKNKYCANDTDRKSRNKHIQTISSPKLLPSKWWPDTKLLIKNFHKRKIGEKLLVEMIHEKIEKDENRMAVICESLQASRFSGMGGIGKTLTATWYAHHYEREYEQIIWIDCSEGNLVQSFKDLARDLEVKNRDELRDDEFPRKCFEILQSVKTLLVYDNAENYKEKSGVIQFLPKAKKSIFCIITSRSGEWGTKDVGYGNIPDFKLDIFNLEESLEFFKTNLDKAKIKYTDYELKELCKLLSYLPLAFQLAVSALINSKIKLHDYISKTSVYDSQILDKGFDDYEKTINGNVKISLDAMSQEINGDIATNILLFLGYLKADDINSKFLLQISSLSLVDLQAAVDLLEKYNLISKTGKVGDFPYGGRIVKKIRTTDATIKVEFDLLSIHRLLQQVIRHNGKSSEKTTLSKILGCEGFIDYKLLPFTKYADEDLQKEFPKVKAELLDQKHLQKLIREGKFEDAVQLARFIHKELKTNTPLFNYAICLEKNGELEEAVVHLEKLLEEKVIEIGKWTTKDNPYIMGILKLEYDLSMDIVAGHLLLIHWKLGNKKRVQEILKSRQEFSTRYYDIWRSTFIQILNSELVNSNYTLQCNPFDSNIIKLILGGKSKNIKLHNCSIDLSIRFPSDLEELTLEGVKFNKEDESSYEFLVNEFVYFPRMKKLTLEGIEGTSMSIDLSEENSLEYLRLEEVKVLNWKKAKWTVKRMELREIDFVERTEMKVKKLEMLLSIVDVSCLPQNIERLSLIGMKDVFCSESPELPNLKYLLLRYMLSSCLSHFTCTQLTHIHFNEIEEVNLDLLPETVQKIKITILSEMDTSIVGRVRKVEKLILDNFPFSEVEEILSHFQTEELVIDYSSGLNSKQLMDLILMNRGITRVFFGEINWDEEDFSESILSTLIDRKSNYYFLEGGKGRGIEEEEFDEFLDL